VRLRFQSSQRDSLLARYSATLGELALRRQTELALVAAKAESDLASRAKSAFLGTMSHELRTPLNAIIGFSDLIKSMKSSDRDALTSIEYASHIANAGRHLLAVVNDILDISKIESGTFSLSVDRYPIGEIIGECIPLVERQIRERQQTLELRIDERLPELDLDARRIKQILVNLLSNANKFTPERGRILVVARRNRDGGATIAVVDSGVGMGPDQLALAMTPFGQVQSHLSRSQEGTGLGLPIARGLARLHGGDLFLESEPDAGTTAVLTLPGPKTSAASGPAARTAGGGERRAPRRKAHTRQEDSP
jgi:two-component system cell cycle sensor histidine kinase PleC